MTRSVVETGGVFADAVLADPPDDPPAAPDDEAEDAGLPPAALASILIPTPHKGPGRRRASVSMMLLNFSAIKR